MKPICVPSLPDKDDCDSTVHFLASSLVLSVKLPGGWLFFFVVVVVATCFMELMEF